MAKQPSVARETAEKMAIAALSYLAAEPEELARFLALSGIEANNVREAAREPAFLPGILDYVIRDERLLIAVAAHIEVEPQAIVLAHQLIAGGTAPT
jgi:hypothetical protein